MLKRAFLHVVASLKICFKKKPQLEQKEPKTHEACWLKMLKKFWLFVETFFFKNQNAESTVMTGMIEIHANI